MKPMPRELPAQQVHPGPVLCHIRVAAI
jgi:hypothetical protein